MTIIKNVTNNFRLGIEVNQYNNPIEVKHSLFLIVIVIIFVAMVLSSVFGMYLQHDWPERPFIVFKAWLTFKGFPLGSWNENVSWILMTKTFLTTLLVLNKSKVHSAKSKLRNFCNFNSTTWSNATSFSWEKRERERESDETTRRNPAIDLPVNVFQ